MNGLRGKGPSSPGTDFRRFVLSPGTLYVSTLKPYNAQSDSERQILSGALCCFCLDVASPGIECQRL